MQGMHCQVTYSFKQLNTHSENYFLRTSVCSTGTDLPNIHAAIRERTPELKARGQFTHFEDRTEMQKDVKCLENAPFIEPLRPSSFVVTEPSLDGILAIKNVLQGVHLHVHFGKTTSILCLLGHGMPEDRARQFRENPIQKGETYTHLLPLPMDHCQQGLGPAYTPHRVTSEASKGDIYIFKSGLISPQWVLDQLEVREAQGVHSTVILILDSCYSGAWVDYFQQQCQFSYTRVIIQTACGPNEVSYGQNFITLWVNLQELAQEIWDVMEISPNASPMQQPQLYISHSEFSSKVVPGCVAVESDGRKFLFFAPTSDFFLKFANYHAMVDPACRPCGASQYQINEMLNKFSRGFVEFYLFRLQELKPYWLLSWLFPSSPMAQVCVTWNTADGSAVCLYLHLHFRAFAYNLELAKITNINIIPQDTTIVGKTKCLKTYLHDPNNSQGGFPLYSPTIVSKFTRFVDNILNDPYGTWHNDPSKWNMSQPQQNRIRSRTDTLNEFLL